MKMHTHTHTHFITIAKLLSKSDDNALFPDLFFFVRDLTYRYTDRLEQALM